MRPIQSPLFSIQIFRCYTSKTDGFEAAKQWLKQLSPQTLPKANFRVTYSRSSGPGGQKVNKTSSKATLTLGNWINTHWIPQEIKRQLVENGFRYATKSGDWVVQSDTLRSREMNSELCYEKLCDEIKKTVVFPGDVSEEDKQKWREVRKSANEQRLRQKQYKAQKKLSRRRDFD